MLIDGGSTHNFVQDSIARFLNLKAQPTHPLRVMVGNGGELRCSQIRKDVQVIIQGHKFTLDFFVMPLAEADLVFGVQWLKTLGPVITNYLTLTDQFYIGDKLVALQGKSAHSPREISHNQVKRLISTNRASAYFHIQMSPTQAQTPPPSPQFPQLMSLLSQFSFLFQTPTALPPSRPTDHAIHLHQTNHPLMSGPIATLISKNKKLRNKSMRC